MCFATVPRLPLPSIIRKHSDSTLSLASGFFCTSPSSPLLNYTQQIMSSENQETPPRHQRPRFLRAITSPLPVLRAFAASNNSATTDSDLQSDTTDAASMLASDHMDHSNSNSGSEDLSSRASRPRPQPLQLHNKTQQQSSGSQDSTLRSFSTSVLSSFLPATSSATLVAPTSPTSPTQPRISIKETLMKERRWSRGQTLNWMPSFTRGHYSEGVDAHPSPVTSSESSRSLKSVQGRQSDCTQLTARSGRHGDEYDYSGGCASLGLDKVSVPVSLNHNQLGLESSMSHLKGNEARTRQASESGQSILSLSSNQSGSGLAERLSGLAQSMRGRRSIAEGHSAPPSSASSPDSSAVEIIPSLAQRSFSDGASTDCKLPVACLNSNQTSDFDSWDDFLAAYGQGNFPNNQCQPNLRRDLGTDFPLLPDYVKEIELSNPPPFLVPPLPPSEERRLRALYSFQILETGIDINFQRVAQLVSTVLGVSGCMICLVDRQDVAIKAHYQAANMECKRGVSLSGHAILRPSDDPLIVLDASLDWRFKNLPAVTGGPKVRFYAGASLATADGLNIGSLCVIDSKPRTEFTEKERMMLVDFASVVMREIELWNDQVQLCTRTRMMRDITRWVRGCLDMGSKESAPQLRQDTDIPSIDSFQPSTAILAVSNGVNPPTFATTSAAVSEPLPTLYNSPPPDPSLPTPTSSPALLSTNLKPVQHSKTRGPRTKTGDRLQDEAFPSACGMIQETMNIDAVYLVQVSDNKSYIPMSGSNVVWNYLGVGARPTGSVGTVGSEGLLQDPSKCSLTYLASSKSSSKSNGFPMDGVKHSTRLQGKSWICTDKSCRPHRLGEAHPDAVEPLWERDMPLISEMLGYVRQETPLPMPAPGMCSLYVVSPNFDDHEIPAHAIGSLPLTGESKRKSLLCHTFQGTLQQLSAGQGSPYKSSIVMPIRGASSANRTTTLSEEPWAYFVVLTSTHTKQFSLHERMYLKNFGSCLVAEVLKRRVEAADKAKGVFIKSISHELRTPLHIILGILELLHASGDETLDDHQLAMIASAEASGKGLIDTINNIIDLADLDPDNNSDSEITQRPTSSLPELYTHVAEVDIRDLCEEVAGAMTKSCIDNNLVIIPAWLKSHSGSLTASVLSSNSCPSTSTRTTAGLSCIDDRIPLNEPVNGDMSSADSFSDFSHSNGRSDQKAAVELLVAMDEPEKDPEQDTPWSFMLNLPVIKRILTQLLENALKFTTTGFVEISAVSPPLSTFPLKPPMADARPILFTVRDTGKGMSPEYVQAHLFQRFSQEDPLQVGTGLGLALVKLLVESLGGWLEIWSEGIEGKGCVVRVLIWATPTKDTVKSLRDEEGAWQEKSCRFYTGESTVSTDRLWKIMGERMMCQDLNMNVQRGNEQDISPEDLLKDLSEQSPCDLLVFNDDILRLKAYLAHWTDELKHIKVAEESSVKTPTPLLMLTSVSTAKHAQVLIDAYLKEWEAGGRAGRLANVVLMPKPIGPLKLMRSLRLCFASEEEQRAAHDSQGAVDDADTLQPDSMSLHRSLTVPNITTMALGVHDNRLLSAGTLIKSTFKFPTSPMAMTAVGDTPVPPHSPGGLFFPPGGDTSVSSDDSISVPKIAHDSSVTKSKSQRTIRNYMSKKHANSRDPTAASVVEVVGTGCPTHVHHPSLVSEDADHSDKLGTLTPVPRVLIVEDNITNRLILRTYLKKRGVSVVEAENGKLGVERFQEEVWRRQGRAGFEFVLMDLQMPVMDGNLATKRIREFEQSMVKQHTSCDSSKQQHHDQQTDNSPEFGKHKYRPSAIFALTGLAGDEDKRLAFECGVDGYLTKPVSLKMLGALLSSCHPSHSEEGDS
ncbi:His Kinase A domain containing protein [Mortierella claussenii]|nr:His Kinase A domain containing protein [Mortierella claussenii]